MSIFSYKNNRFRFLGITLFNFKCAKDSIYLKILGVPCYKCKGELFNIYAEFKSSKDFDTRKFDQRINNLIKLTNSTNNKKDKSKIGYLVSEMYDIGGHTKCIKDLILSLSNNYKQFLFATQKSICQKKAPLTLSAILPHITMWGLNADFIFFHKKLKKFCEQIISSNIKTLLVYIHPDDIFGACVLAYLKQATDIQILYFNHASHYPALGMSFSNIILECMPSTEKLTHFLRKHTNTKIIGLQSVKANDTIYFTKEQINELKTSLNIPENALITMSGASSYKFFDENDSEYFKMIKNLLEDEPTVVHIVMTKLNKKEETIINSIFNNAEELKQRLKIVPFQTSFDKWFQMADVFIDSFPVSSALTQIDLMRNKVASVVKINSEKPEFSFHEYQMPNYPYMFENISDMKNAIKELLHDENKRNEIIEKNYEYWLNTYESSVVRDKYIKIIEA